MTAVGARPVHGRDRAVELAHRRADARGLRFVSRLTDDGAARAAPRGCAASCSARSGATGHGHGSVPAVVLGLAGEQPAPGRPGARRTRRSTRVRATGRLLLAGKHEIDVRARRRHRAAPRRRPRLPQQRDASSHALDADGGLLARRDLLLGGRRLRRSTRTRRRPGGRRDDPTPRPVPVRTAPPSCSPPPARPGCRSAASCSPTSAPGATSRRSGRACCTAGR